MDIMTRLRISESLTTYYQNTTEDKEKKRKEKISSAMKTKWQERKKQK